LDYLVLSQFTAFHSRRYKAMPQASRRRVRVKTHSGSSLEDIINKPDCGSHVEHRIGFRNRQTRVPHLNYRGDERHLDLYPSKETIEVDELEEKYQKCRQRVERGTS
jgi:nitrate reductase (NAD(P)H)